MILSVAAARRSEHECDNRFSTGGIIPFFGACRYAGEEVLRQPQSPSYGSKSTATRLKTVTSVDCVGME